MPVQDDALIRLLLQLCMVRLYRQGPALGIEAFTGRLASKWVIAARSWMVA
jgi:hypothetical protein